MHANSDPGGACHTSRVRRPHSSVYVLRLPAVRLGGFTDAPTFRALDAL